MGRRLARHLLGLFGREISKGGVDASEIIVMPGLVLGGPVVLVDELDLQRVEEAFHLRVIVAVADPAHGRHGADCGELIDIGL